MSTGLTSEMLSSEALCLMEEAGSGWRVLLLRFLEGFLNMLSPSLTVRWFLCLLRGVVAGEGLEMLDALKSSIEGLGCVDEPILLPKIVEFGIFEFFQKLKI